ncbi:MAG: DUF1127 domain-containing protein [Alphaproteobacteria bacterium]|jgi:uncharacterized protein YjiS (DUF1127 family)|nr:DUF1127 domain-containing protein [Alphaproteobacteria bacterium]
MTTRLLPDLTRGLIAPVARLFDALEQRSTDARSVRLTRREREYLDGLSDHLLDDVGLVRDRHRYRQK